MPKVVDHDERRREVAQVVLRCIARDGVDGATLRSVARESGWSTGVLHHYFRDKDELVAAALQLLHERSAQRYQQSLEAPTGREALRRLLLDQMPMNGEQVEEWAAWVQFWGYAAAHPELAAEINRAWGEWRKSLEHLIQSGQADGSIDTDLDAAEEAAGIAAMIDGVGVRALYAGSSTGHKKVSPQWLGDHMTQLIMSRMTPQPGTPEPSAAGRKRTSIA
ncbi:TetR/AcrR family transcriptional regulator [Frankia sp. Cr2]|uniref:TetR/AcrR family transcriptional regulator n=1 Tax=Frankia sp. Cr2 TaxID=3073932 RepID=UPI002AD2C531|nr:TetR/AcrR family transcriptional regulator [Frankia sp. Cr2]